MGDQLLPESAPAPLPAMVTCLSLDQPYAGLVAARLKKLETRLFPWPENARPYPSPLLICATLKVDKAVVARLRDRIFRLTSTADEPLFSARGVALAVVDVVGCRVLTADDEPLSWYWDPVADKGKTRYAWTLANVRRVKPFAVKGRQGFAMAVPREVVEKAMAEWKGGR